MYSSQEETEKNKIIMDLDSLIPIIKDFKNTSTTIKRERLRKY